MSFINNSIKPITKYNLEFKSSILAGNQSKLFKIIPICVSNFATNIDVSIATLKLLSVELVSTIL